MGKLSREKGKAFERAIARKLRPLFGSRIMRGYQARSGKAACDVEGTSFWFECKHAKVVNVRAALAQGLLATDGRPVVVIAKDNGTRPFVVMDLEAWLEMVPAAVVAAIRAAAGGDNGGQDDGAI